MIPARLIRTVPETTTAEVEGWWQGFADLHPAWELVTYRDPIDPAEFPISAPAWERCRHGAQRAGLIRLEAVLALGGVYVDSDVECLRQLDPLRNCTAFAGWEDRKVVPDAVFGAEAGHPAIEEMLAKAVASVLAGGDPWASGPGVFTSTLPGRWDTILFPPGTLYPYHYKAKHLRGNDHRAEQPWAHVVHHWHGSWLPR